ncbi:hypothetical protein [Leptothrix sp. BB-3]
MNARAQLGRDAVRVVLDVDDATARMGYGDFEAVALLKEGDVDVRVEPGLRTCVLVCDGQGYAFFTPPMLVELQDDQHVGINALVLQFDQVDAVLNAFFPVVPQAGRTSSPPELGQRALSDQKMVQVKAALDADPPQKFDLARKVNVFNAFIEFVELRLTGLRIAQHTVRLPNDLLPSLSDDTTIKRLLTTFQLVGDDSNVAKGAAEIDRKVRALRDQYTRPVGKRLGSVLLRSKLPEFDSEVRAIRNDIREFQAQVAVQFQTELDASRTKLVDALLPIVEANPPAALRAQVNGSPSSEVVKRYVDKELDRVFPRASSLVEDMTLEWIRKGVTFQTLSDPDFQRAVKDAFPYADWVKPFREFEAAPGNG